MPQQHKSYPMSAKDAALVDAVTGGVDERFREARAEITARLGAQGPADHADLVALGNLDVQSLNAAATDAFTVGKREGLRLGIRVLSGLLVALHDDEAATRLALTLE